MASIGICGNNSNFRISPPAGGDGVRSSRDIHGRGFLRKAMYSASQ